MGGSEIGPFGPSVVLGTFVLFCRVGSCLMVAPGVSTSQIPMQVRLMVAVAITLGLAPMLLPMPELRVVSDDPLSLLKVIITEGLIGAVIGALGRFFFSALESLAVASANLLGLVNPFGVSVDSAQPIPPIATAVTLAATALVFVSDLHWEIIRGVVASYNVIKIGADFDSAYSLRQVGATLGQSFLIAVRVSSPFFLYSILANFALTLINRVTPQISVFYVAPPFIVAGGIILLYFVVKAEVSQFVQGFLVYLRWG